jgi:DNA-directed RNA polymerase subunit RPC12/RpoP
MRVKIECPNIFRGGPLPCGYPFEAAAENESVRCPACNQSVNVKKLVEKRQYKLIR